MQLPFPGNRPGRRVYDSFDTGKSSGSRVPVNHDSDGVEACVPKVRGGNPSYQLSRVRATLGFGLCLPKIIQVLMVKKAILKQQLSK